MRLRYSLLWCESTRFYKTNYCRVTQRFKHYAEANNLKEKSEYADRQREKVSQDMTDYGLRHTPFKDWAAGNYAL